MKRKREMTRHPERWKKQRKTEQRVREKRMVMEKGKGMVTEQQQSMIAQATM